MGRPRTGSTFLRHGVRVLQIKTDRPGAKKPRHIMDCPPRKDGRPMSERDAKDLARDLQRAYDAGKWDPWAVVTPDRSAASDAPAPPISAYAFAAEWAKAQTYDTADEDLATLERYLAGSPLGALSLRDLRPTHAIAFIRELVARPSAMGGTLSSRTVRGCVDVVRRAIDAAIVAEHCSSNPFGLSGVRKELPAIADKHPGARAGWVFAWNEVRSLVYDARVRPDRRVWNAISFGTGARPQSAAVLRWRDWDRAATPLTRLMIVRGRKRKDGREGGTKTGALMPCPVHPSLARILTAWWESGWADHYGRAPTLDDLIVPTKDFEIRKQGRVNRYFKADCKRLGLRERFSYTTRHAFATLAVEDGGDPALLEQITHAPPQKSVSGYRRLPWGRLCAEVIKLQFPTWTQDTPPVAEVPLRVSLQDAVCSEIPESFPVGATGFEEAAGVSWCCDQSPDGRDRVAASPDPGSAAAPDGRLAPRLAPGGAIELTPRDVLLSLPSALWGWGDRALVAELLAELSDPPVAGD